jgi:hypothetical protein
LPQVPAWPRVQSRSTFSSAGEASGEYQNELSHFFIRRQGSSFLPRSSLRALSGRVAHPPERLPRALLFRAVRPTGTANCPRPALHKPTQSSCAANPPRCALAMTCCGWRRPREEPIGSRARLDSTVRCGRAVTYGIDSGADAAKSVSAHRIGTAAIGR